MNLNYKQLSETVMFIEQEGSMLRSLFYFSDTKV